MHYRTCALGKEEAKNQLTDLKETEALTRKLNAKDILQYCSEYCD